MVVFDDREFPGCGTDDVDFGPLSDLRATFELRTGMLTTLERLAREWRQGGGVAALWAPDSIREIVSERNELLINHLPDDDRVFLVNGRWSFPGAKFTLEPDQALVESDSRHVVAAELSRADARRFLAGGELPSGVETLQYHGQLLIRFPWEILNLLPTTLQSDLMLHEPDPPSARPPGVVTLGEEDDEPIYIHPTARVFPTAVLDNTGGPIVIDAEAIVRPGAIIIGPAYIGARTSVLDHALIKANTSIGPLCKVAGEVGASIFQGFSNKAHDGHLGDSFVGEWVNLGAGTTNSNLLNTYGEVVARLRPGGPRRRTGRMYLGTIFGDHVKTAIGTRLMTGTVTGTGAMIAASTPPPATVPAFAWITDAAGDRQTYRLDKFLEVARTAMDRRHVELSAAMEKRLSTLHAIATGKSV